MRGGRPRAAGLSALHHRPRLEAEGEEEEEEQEEEEEEEEQEEEEEEETMKKQQKSQEKKNLMAVIQCSTFCFVSRLEP